MNNVGRTWASRVLGGALLVLGTQVMACSDAPSENENTPGSGGNSGAGAGGSSAGGSGGAGQGGTAGSAGASAGSGGSAAGTGGAAGSAGECKVDGDCEAKLPTVNPPNCAEARCEGGTCVFRAKDKDGDGQAAKFCKDPSQTVEIAVGKDCDDSDKTRYPGAWDGPAGDGNEGSCDGVDNDCSGAADDSVLADGTSCECKPGAVASCSEDSGGKKIVRTYAVALSGCGQFSAGFGEVSC